MQLLKTVALEAAANGIIITDRQGTILWANPAFVRMTGFDMDEIIGANPRIMRSGKQTREQYEQMWNTILSGQAWQGVIINRRKNGSVYYEEQTITPVRGEDGTITNFVAIKQDITSRIQAEEQQKAEAARSAIMVEASEILADVSLDYQAVLDTIAERLAHLVGDACVLHLTADGETGLKLAAIHAQSAAEEDILTDRFRTSISNRYRELGRKVVNTSKPVLMHIPEGDPDATELGIHSLMVVPLMAQDRSLGLISMLRYQNPVPYSQEDILLMEVLADRASMKMVNTQLYRDLLSILQKEQSMRDELIQTEKFAALGRMVASVTHELNNPLQTIQNCLYLIQQELPGGTSLEFLDLATSEVQRLAGLVAELRDVYRPRLVDQRVPCDVGKLLGEVAALISPFTGRNLVTMKLQLPDKPVIIEAIPDQLKQVFINISMNAIEAMQPNGGELEIQVVQPEDTPRVGIVFHDNGPGILPENISRIFEPLYTTKETGSGLGLSLSYDVIHNHGGEIQVESQPGSGTTFTILLPKQAPDNNEAIHPGDQEQMPG